MVIVASVSFCRNCERFLSPPQAWVQAKPESSELLAICLKRLKGLNKVRLKDAHFIWTEPHSKRLRVSLTIQKEVCIVFCKVESLLTSAPGPHEYYPGADLRNRVSRSAWSVPRLHKTCCQKYLESSGPSPSKGPPQKNIPVP